MCVILFTMSLLKESVFAPYKLRTGIEPRKYFHKRLTQAKFAPSPGQRTFRLPYSKKSKEGKFRRI